jgi:hypothetical protein
VDNFVENCGVAALRPDAGRETRPVAKRASIRINLYKSVDYSIFAIT